jgi:catechol 2,3-dioxygenase-like lactoylglutathione lyase family enzyme
VEILSSRILVRPRDPAASRRFYRDVLGLAVYREFGPPDSPGLVFFLGQGFLELAGHPSEPTDTTAPGRHAATSQIWLQVRDVAEAHRQLAGAGVTIVRPPRTEPWGLIEMWITDPDGLPIVIVEVPADHPLRRDSRAAP